MKVYITENIDKIIEGYQMVPIVYGKIDTNAIPNNAAQEVIAHDALDSVPANLLYDFITNIVQKMRRGAMLCLGGTDLKVISKDVISEALTTTAYNDLVYSKRGIYSVKDILNLLNKKEDITIEEVKIEGYKYEIYATRKQKNTN